MNITDSVGELINFARQHSPYYREHFAEVPGEVALLTELPIIDPDAFWRHSETLDLWPVLTDSAQGALVFRTGGSTSAG